ncbi:MAG: 3-hydroxyacyl-CoA dehydrogenase NAD-binding domain-containing protein, partial [Betaproteobacteria bacterium]
DVRAIVIACEGKTFIAGADVREFNQPPLLPHLGDVIHAIEESPKPVIAAIHGTALGGGFEVALGCHFRIATASAKLGLPEVSLGLLPGAGGTQRLPRLIGVKEALEMITSGKPVSAQKALALGAIDEIAAGELVVNALAFAGRLVDSGREIRRTRSLPIEPVPATLFDDLEHDLARKYRGLIAPLQCVKAVRGCVDLPFEVGLKQERELFLALKASPQSKALRHAFFGEREVAKIPGLPADTAIRDIRSVAVIGAGTMGGGIAMCFANAGIAVTLLDAKQEALDRGMSTIGKNYAATVAKGGLRKEEMDRRLSLITPRLDIEAISNADLIIEAVFEDIDVKKTTFEAIDRIAKPGAILASNTSYLDVSKIASFTSRPADVVGMHFFSPANVMKLLENVRTANTAPDVLATVMQVGKRLGKVAVLVGGADGFVGNRMLAQRSREVLFLLEEGALPQQVDSVLVEFGFAMGPFAVSDLAGLDIGWRNRQSRAHLRKPGVRDCNLLDKVCELGRFGQKTSAGWYHYEAGSRVPLADPLIERLIVDHSKEHGIVRRKIDSAEILERCLYSMINEAAKILQEGVAARAVDVDMVWLHGYGFPRYRGGPLFYADEVGVKSVYEAILKYRDQFGPDFWTPAPLLEEMAEAGKSFYEP